MTTPVNGIYVLQGVDPAQIAAAPVAAKVVDLYVVSGNLFTPAQVATMESGGGAVLGYFSIGEAENYRPYFSSLPSSVLGPVDPSWPGDYEVAYWSPQWLTVAENYIQTMINQGFKGAFFDVVDEAFTSWAQQNAPGGDAQGAMTKLIQELSGFARAQDPNFQIWLNSSGAEPMMSDPALLSAINGVYEEQLYYQNATKATGSADLAFNVSLLDNVTKAGKSVVAVEYVSSASAVSSVETQAAADGFGYYIANPDLNLVGVDTQGFTGSSAGGGGGGGGGTGGTAPTVTITSAGGATTSAAHTVSGTVDVADAGSTVTILDGATKIGTATVDSTGAWSANVTLPNQGGNAITATDTNATGTGTSNQITFTLSTPVTSAPTVAITSAGGTVTQASQTVAGTVDLADAGSTVTILDGTTAIGTALVNANGKWSTSVTLPNQGGNTITATDSNAGGTGTSNAITLTLTTPVAGVPTVAITSGGGTVSQASQTIGGTVDLADAGSTVTILDGTTPIGTAAVDSSGNWSTGVTLANQGANVLTATDANSAGTGTSDPVTLNLQSLSQGSGTAPTLTIADDALTVASHGGTVDLGIDVSSPAGATNTRVIIQGLSWYETITDGLGDTFRGGGGGRIRLSETQVDSGLTLTSNYLGTRHPVNTLTITAKDTIDGVTAASDPQTIVVTDPPGTSSGSVASTSWSGADKLALLRQHMAGDFGDGSSGALQSSTAPTDHDRWSAVLSASRH
jgi:uncharacterized protein (TIGR01370 family)